MISITACPSIRPGRWLAAVAFSALLTALSCREHLPAYEDPTDLLEANIHATFVYRSDLTAVYMTLVLVNRYDETLEDVLDLEGTITVTLLRDASTVRTFTLTPAQLAASGYEPNSRRLRIDPGRSVTLQVLYDFRDDSGRDLTTSVLRFQSDPTCPQRMVTGPEIYDIRASARLFARTKASDAPPLSYVLCLPVPFIEDRVCLGPKGDHPETALCP